MYKEALKIKRNYAEAKEGLGNAYYKIGSKLYNQNKFKEASDSFKKGFKYLKNKKLFLSAIENCNLHLKVTAVNKLIKEADKKYKRRKYKKAGEIYKKIAQIKPELFNIKINEARCYFQMQDYDAAEIIFKDLVKKFPDKAEIVVELADFYVDTGKLEEAVEIIKIAERKNPQYYKLYYVKGVCLAEQNKVPEALKNFRRALKLNPKFYEVHIDMGNAYYKSYKYLKAEKEYKIVFSHEPNNIFAIYNLGVIFLKKGRYTAALRNFKRVETFLQNYPSINYHIGKAYYYQKKYQAAMRYMKKAVDMKLDILYVWGLANSYAKLIHHPSYTPASMKKRAMEVLNMCMKNRENNKISLMARRAILKLNPREKLLYASRIPIDIHFVPIIAGGHTYVYSDKRESFLKLEKESENILWEMKETAPPSCQFDLGKYFYTGLENGTVIAIDKEEGTVEWKYNEYITKIEAIGDDLLAINGDNNLLLCLASGDLKWKFELDSDDKHKIVTTDKSILYYNNNKMINIDPESGKQEWIYDFSGKKTKIANAGISDDYIFVNTKKGKNNFLLTMDKKTGKKLWEKSIPGSFQNPPMVYNNRIICILDDGMIYTFYKDGSIKWNKKFKEEIISGAIHGNKLYISFQSALIYGLQVTSGKIVWSYKMKDMDKDKLFMIYYTQ